MQDHIKNALEAFVGTMQWTETATDYEKTLVLGNLNGFAAALSATPVVGGGGEATLPAPYSGACAAAALGLCDDERVADVRMWGVDGRYDETFDEGVEHGRALLAKELLELATAASPAPLVAAGAGQGFVREDAAQLLAIVYDIENNPDWDAERLESTTRMLREYITATAGLLPSNPLQCRDAAPQPEATPRHA